MKIAGAFALVPVKPFTAAKSRLSGALSDGARRHFARSLLENTLSVLRSAAGIEAVAVVSRDPEVELITKARGALLLGEASTRLDSIVDGALAELGSRGASSALVVLADLPDLCAEDVERMLSLGERSEIVIAPDAEDEGTNALFLRPPSRMKTCFGRRNSFQAHCERARELGIDPAVLRAHSLAFDVDSTDDLARLSESTRGMIGRGSAA